MRHPGPRRGGMDRIFPFLFGRAFIEAEKRLDNERAARAFPFLFGRAFIEAKLERNRVCEVGTISLPFRKGFH